MPGHMLTAKCSCGFHGNVMPGVSERLGMSHRVVAYDPSIGQLVTMLEHEAVRRGLQMFPNPYLKTKIGSLSSWESSTFRCPKCCECNLKFTIDGFWD